MFKIEDIAKLLPVSISIVRSPDYTVCKSTESLDIEMDIVEMKPVDVIKTFMLLQRMATKEACKIENKRQRLSALKSIRAMNYFSSSTREIKEANYQ